MKRAVFLVHGLYMTPLVMALMERRLQRLGYTTFNFGYRTRHVSGLTLKKMSEAVNSMDAQDITLVGHSMGGLLIHYLVARYRFPHKRLRIVTLGTPYNGSTIVKQLAKTPLSTPLFGHESTQSLLARGLREVSKRVPVGVVIGTNNLGVGKVFGIDEGDGTVATQEAELDWATDEIYFNVTHAGLLYSKRVISSIDRFIQRDHF